MIAEPLCKNYLRYVYILRTQLYHDLESIRFLVLLFLSTRRFLIGPWLRQKIYFLSSIVILLNIGIKATRVLVAVVCLRKLWNLILSGSVSYPKLMDERHWCLHDRTDKGCGFDPKGLVLGLILWPIGSNPMDLVLGWVDSILFWEIQISNVTLCSYEAEPNEIKTSFNMS